MAHQALARKHRPRSFSEVATQGHVSETLRRSVATDRVAHAYLFSGPRGVGKTTLARVLAMALNCPDRDADGEPCGVCESCARIWGGHTALDVVEIDAATHRGVDDARDLRERAMYAPSADGRFKVYIVDEAHMLTREAWNALLKILEEPPPRVIFVFATTEPQKIEQAASPILSRCQRFDFRRIGVADLVQRLADVLANEGASASDEALRTIARRADGGMRDAISLLDQVLSLTGSEVSIEAVRRVLGLVDEERFLELLDILIDARHADLFAFVERLLDDGYDIVEFYHSLVDVLRGLLRVRLSGDDSLSDVAPHLREAFSGRAAAFDATDLARMLALASELESQGSLRRSEQPRFLLEMLLLRLSYLDRTVTLEELIARLGGERPITSEPRSRPVGSDAAESTPTEPPPREAASEELAPPEESRASTVDSSVADPTPTESAQQEEPMSGGEPSAGEEAPVKGNGSPLPAVTAGDLLERWEWLLEQGKGLPAGMRVPLRAGQVVADSDSVLRLTLPEGPALDRLNSEPTQRKAVADALSAAVGRPVSLVVEGPSGTTSKGRNGRVTQETVREGRLAELIQQEPGLKQAVIELDLELLE